jgi:enoyl-CoA hydratase
MATDAMGHEIIRLLADAHNCARVVVLDGTGPDFCLGRAGMGSRPIKPQEALDRRRTSEVIYDTYGAVRSCKVPVVCAARGRVEGFGCAIASVCDLTIAADTARFSIPEMEHNIMPTMVMSALIDRATMKGLHYLVYTAVPVSAERAMMYGLVSDIVPAPELDAAVDKLSARIISFPAVATEGTKEYLRRAFGMTTPDAVDFARNIHAVINSSSEIKQGRTHY